MSSTVHTSPKILCRRFIVVLSMAAVFTAFAPETVLAARRHGGRGGAHVRHHGSRHSGHRNIAARRGHVSHVQHGRRSHGSAQIRRHGSAQIRRHGSAQIRRHGSSAGHHRADHVRSRRDNAHVRHFRSSGRSHTRHGSTHQRHRRHRSVHHGGHDSRYNIGLHFGYSGYGGHSSSHGYYRGGYSRYYVHEPHVAVPRYYVVEDYPSGGTGLVRSTIAHDDTGGWLLLNEGDADEALQFFSQQAQNNPSRGIPKIGYAIAVAETGNLTDGVRAMRRALRIDPSALHYLTIDPKLRPTVEGLIEHYAHFANESADDPDPPFMIAALRYLLREPEVANHAMLQAVSAGDRSESTINLDRLIGEQLKEFERIKTAPSTRPQPNDGEAGNPNSD